jgi:hypothetical protein
MEVRASDRIFVIDEGGVDLRFLGLMLYIQLLRPHRLPTGAGQPGDVISMPKASLKRLK